MAGQLTPPSCPNTAAIFGGLSRAQAILAVQRHALVDLEDEALGHALDLLALSAQDELRTVERSAVMLLGAVGND